MKNSNNIKPPLVYVWIGKHFPEWARLALKLTNLNSGLVTILLSSKSIGSIKEVNQQYFLEDFYIPPKKISKDFEEKRSEFRDGFWLKTTERFFVLQQFINKYSLNSIFHAELDNLIFDISNLNYKLDSIGEGFFCPRDSLDRGIASLVYINQPDSLTELTEMYIRNTLEHQNDMLLIGSLFKKSNNFHSLPTENAFEKNREKKWKAISTDDTGGIFDAASIGQFLFGIDPRNCNTPLFNGYENENRGFNLWDLKFINIIENNRFQIIENKSNTKLNLYNIHVHSKLFNIISNQLKLSNIIESINSGKKTFMSLNFKNWRGIQRLRKQILI